jgi:proteasome lid subunit RPN8/RPN11
METMSDERPRPELHVTASALERVREHAREAYPAECCGALLGRARRAGVPAAVVRAVALHNECAGRRERRYLIGGPSVLEIERDAARDGLAVVGFYHSHPDQEPEPSALDRAQAWPTCAYLIVGVAGGEAGPVRAWCLRDDRSRLDEEDVVVLEEEP